MEEKNTLIQELSHKYELTKELDEKLNVVDKEINELEIFELHLKDITSNGKKEILASLGKGVYVKSDMIDSKLLVDVGSNIFVKKGGYATFPMLVDSQKNILKFLE